MFTDDNKKFCKFVDCNLMLHIISNNYKSWDYYCINYLISDKELRNTLNSLSSKKIKFHENRGEFFLSELCDKDPSKPLFGKTIKNKFTENEKKLSIIFTNENKQNFINTLLSYKIIIGHKLMNKKSFIFDFNFKEMKKLIKIYFKWNLPKFLKKNMFIDVEKQIIDINKVYLSIMEDAFLDYVVDYEEVFDIEKQHIELEIL